MMTVAKKYTQYPEDILSGKIIACQYVKDVCARFLSWLQHPDKDFRSDKVEHVVTFVE